MAIHNGREVTAISLDKQAPVRAVITYKNGNVAVVNLGDVLVKKSEKDQLRKDSLVVVDPNKPVDATKPVVVSPFNLQFDSPVESLREISDADYDAWVKVQVPAKTENTIAETTHPITGDVIPAHEQTEKKTPVTPVQTKNLFGKAA
jgi:hypothetical protein